MRISLRKAPMLLSALLALVVLFSSVPAVHAANTTATVNKKVYITSKSYVQLLDANLIPSASGATASFTFTFFNGDNSDIILNDYWARLKTTGGAKLKLSLLDQSKKKIAPNSSVQLTYYSEVGANITLSQLIVSIVKFDFSVSGYERTVAQFTFPKDYTNEVKDGGFKPIQINNSSVNMRVDQINVVKKDDNFVMNLTYVARNTSKFGVSIPGYNYYVSTPAGLFKLTLKKAEDANLLLEPTVLNAVRLTGSLPATLSTKNWKFIITNNAGAEGNTVELPVVIFDIPFQVGNATPETSSDTAMLSSDYGTYELKLTNVQRLPWTTKDEVITEIKIANKESVFLPMPKLNGQLVIDDNIKLESKQIMSTDEIGIAPGETKTVHYVGQIPFNYAWKKLMLELSENSSEDGAATSSIQLTNSKITPVKTIKLNETYKQSVLGWQLSAKVSDVRTYKNDDSDLFTVYLDITNDQNRSTQLSSWAGYFKTADGLYYEAKSIKSPNLIKPTNKEQLIVYAELPVDSNKEGIQLYLGEAFDENGIIKGNGTAQGYVRPILLELPAENKEITSFNNLKVGPYTFDMTMLVAFINEGILSLDLGATLNKDRSYDGFTQNKIILELERESTGQIILTHVIDLEKAAEGGTLWKVGSNYHVIKKDLSKVPVWDSYTLNIYEPLENHKRKIASKEIKWSPHKNWMADTNN